MKKPKVEAPHFKVKNIISFKDAINNKMKLPTSDLCFTSNEHIIQYDYVEMEEQVNTITVHPGTYALKRVPGGIKHFKIDFHTGKILDTIDNTKEIKNQMEMFFDKLDIYKKRKLPLKRSILLYGPPGTGKTQSIKQAALDSISEEPGTAVIVWPTSDINASMVADFFSSTANFTNKVKRVILIAEDIGGTEIEGPVSSRGANSDLLNFLDGINVVFKKPTFIIATTNYPEQLLLSLADRPGRFDQLIEIPPPPAAQKIKLLEFMMERRLSLEEKQELSKPSAEYLTIAHLSEIMLRMELHDKTLPQVLEELISHTAKVEAAFKKSKNKIGL